MPISNGSSTTSGRLAIPTRRRAITRYPNWRSSSPLYLPPWRFARAVDAPARDLVLTEATHEDDRPANRCRDVDVRAAPAGARVGRGRIDVRSLYDPDAGLRRSALRLRACLDRPGR